MELFEMQGLDDSKFLPNLVRIDIIKFSQGGNKDNKKSKNKLIIPKILSTIKVPRENVLPGDRTRSIRCLLPLTGNVKTLHLLLSIEDNQARRVRSL